MKFWENNVCTFDVLQNETLINKDQKIQAVIITFFKREEYYKHFGIYIKGLKKCLMFIENFNKSNPSNTYDIILFIDQNIYKDKQIMSLIEGKSFVIVVTFNCSNFKQGNYHVDLFGTLIRFFPMFNFPNNPVSCCIIIDVDLHDEDFIRVENMMKFKPDGLTASGIIKPLLFEKKRGYIFAGSMCLNVKEKYDRSILENFIFNAQKHDSLGLYGKRTTTFGFGIDEIFLNEILVPIIKDFWMALDYQLSYILFHTKDYLYEEKRNNVTQNVFSYILGKYDRPNSTIEEKYNLIDASTYLVRERTEMNSYISKRFYDVIEYQELHKKKWIPRRLVKLIHKNLMDVISATVIVRTNVNARIKDVQIMSPIYVSDPKRANKAIVIQ